MAEAEAEPAQRRQRQHTLKSMCDLPIMWVIHTLPTVRACVCDSVCDRVCVCGCVWLVISAVSISGRQRSNSRSRERGERFCRGSDGELCQAEANASLSPLLVNFISNLRGDSAFDLPTVDAVSHQVAAMEGCPIGTGTETGDGTVGATPACICLAEPAPN